MHTAKILHELEAYARGYSAIVGHVFTRDTIKITALTGTAAIEIGGQTTAREFALMQNTPSLEKYQPSFSDTRLCVVDEISFLSYADLGKLSLHLQQFTECTEHNFGKHSIVFLGDFCQLQCIGNDCIYLHENSIYWEQTLTHMVELKGKHRYSKCPQLMKIMPEMRDNGLSDEAREILNSRVIDKEHVSDMNFMKIRHATYHNKNRAQINAKFFRDYLNKYHGTCDEHNIPKSAIVIRAGAEWQKANRKLSFDQRKVLFTSCCDTDCENSYKTRCDPLLCLISNCFLMGTENEDVKNGAAIGTTSTFEKIVLKKSAKAAPMLMHGKWVYGIDAEDVDYLLLRWHDCRFKGTFKVHLNVRRLFNVRYPLNEPGFARVIRTTEKILMTQFPVVLNHATTGHKLQGKSLDQLIVAEWSSVKNWAYFVLSRVRTLDGLFLRSKIPEKINFTPDPNYIAMMDRLRAKIADASDETLSSLQDFDIEEFVE